MKKNSGFLSKWMKGGVKESVTVVLYDGRPEQRKAVREEYFGDGKFSVLLTHYDLIMKDKKFLNRVHWFYLIVDAGHLLKNHECALARTLVTGNKIKVTPKPLNATAKMLQPPLPLCQ
ncbi:putative ATP-dependent DNA helicase CHR719 [Carex rostrata]